MQTVAVFLQIFSEFGVPDEIHSDRGANFTSQLFISFCKGLNIKLSFSSAYHHNGNPDERAVRTIKNIMKKCAHTKTNWRLGLLEYPCTPLSEKLSSPTELLSTHWYKGVQPTLHARLLPHSTMSDYNTEQLIAEKDSEKANHDRSAHDLPILPVGCIVTYFDPVSRAWLLGRIAQWTHNHAYLIESKTGRLVSHNRCDICRSHLTFVPHQPEPYQNHQSVQAEKPNPELVSVDGKPSIKQARTSHPTARHHVSGSNSQASSGLVTRSGRVVHKPDRLNL